MSFNEIYEKELAFQANRRRATVKFIRIISDLWYDNTVELVLFRNQLLDRNVSEILNLVEYASDFVEKPISIFDAVEIAQEIKNHELPPSKIDIGKLVYESHLDEDKCTIKDFIEDRFKDAKNNKKFESKDVVLYGFGRIGRLLARELVALTGKGNLMRLRAIVTRGEITESVLEKRASLLRNDSVHGDFHGTVTANIEKKALIINGTTVHVISANNPEEIDYTRYGISDALVIDNTGAFRDEESLGRHIKAKGIAKVLLTAPGKGIPNIVHGVNQLEYDPSKIDIFSAASCTTNAITPVLKVIEDNFGVINGHLETIHAYTNDQNLVDNMHKKYRRGRAAALNMVITETGAGKAVSKALPSFEGKLTSSAIRVPVPNGSLAILNLRLENAASKETINNTMKKYCLEGDLVEQIRYSLSNELVSSDIVGTPAPAIFDSHATISNGDGKNVVLYVWYDNEYGYTHQVIRLAKYISQLKKFTYY
ncbi:MAG: glyceraldehyde-3-phosphate dehydrogenase [Lutibacter sp.]|uniref:glyceraldehyde-3-phosphate dehydrogenase n=1 Tax=Lutibacter sp. TaxID=1925666 RepID=UPI0038587C63